MPINQPCSPAQAGAQRERVASAGPPNWTPAFAGERLRIIPALSLLFLLAACATQTGAAVAPAAPGFLHGVWHGFIFPIAWVLSLFMPDVSVYAVPNNGGWYDFGYFIGVCGLGVGARKGRVRVRRN